MIRINNVRSRFYRAPAMFRTHGNERFAPRGGGFLATDLQQDRSLAHVASQCTSYRTETKYAGSSRLLALQDIGRSAEEPPNWNCLWRHNGAARVRARSGPSTVVAKHQANSSSGRTNSCCLVLACPYHHHHPAGDRGTAHRTMRLIPGSRCTVCRSSAALPYGGNNWHRYRVCC